MRTRLARWLLLTGALGCGSETGPCDVVYRTTQFAASLTAVPPATFAGADIGMVMEDYGRATSRRPAAVRWFPTSVDSVSSTLRGAIDTVATSTPAIELGPPHVVVSLDSLVASGIIDPLVNGAGRFYLLDPSGVVVAAGPIQRVSGGELTPACVE